MSREIRRVLKTERVELVVGFNPVPWGSIATTTAALQGVPGCLSLIGMDFLQIQKNWGLPFRTAVKRAAAVTVTGQEMFDGLVALGVERSRIHILPHSVDLERFCPGGTGGIYDIVTVGQLIPRKRMDILLDAIALSRDRGLSLRLGILGKGPLEVQLRAQCERLRLSNQVEFLGYRDDVETILQGAKVFALASEWEGVPFALMEAMATGVVPIVTKVGTIADWVIHGKNGMLVPVNNPACVAESL